MGNHMGKVGFATGTVIGFMSRDHFMFTMPEKMDAIRRDYNNLNEDIQKRIYSTQRDI